MATLIAHGSEQAAHDFAQRLAKHLGDQRGVTTAVQEFPLAGRYVDNVDAIIVVAEAQDEAFHREARNFLAAQYAETDRKSLFVAALGDAETLTSTQRTAIDAFEPRDVGYFRTAAPYDDALKIWAGRVNTRGAV